MNVLKWSTSTVYGGDRVGVIPPSGGAAAQQVFDATGRLVALRQFHGPTLTGPADQTAYTYDHAGRLIQTTDSTGLQWTTVYDLLGRVTRRIDPDTGTASTTYDAAGRVDTTTDGRGRTLAYKYDDLDRITELHEGTLTGPQRAQWTYDPTGAKGLPSTSTRYDAGLAYATAVTGYNDSYQPTSVSTTIPASTANGVLAGTYITDHTYATNGTLATTTLPAAGPLAAETLTYTYSNPGFPATITSPLATYLSDASFAYDGQMTQQVIGASGARVRTLTTYDPASRRLATSTTSTETATVGTYQDQYSSTYGFDPAGNLTSIAGATNTGSGLVADQEECFTYDYLRRLTTAWTQTSGACTTPQRTGADPYWRTWTFDATGNRLTQIDKNPVAGDTTWTSTVGSAGGVKPHQVNPITATGPKAGTPTRAFGYDATGNTTSLTTATGAVQTLTWDTEGHLAAQTAGANTTSYLYDVDGSRLIRRDPDGSATLYLAGQELKKSPTNTLTATRYYGATASRTAAGLTWLIPDGQGTTQAMVDPTTLVPTRRRTMPYGEPRGTQPVWANDKVFVGGTADPTNLVHLGAREYDPTTGRFISVDPLRDPLDPQQWHGYSYAGNSPTNNADPSGLIYSDFYEGAYAAQYCASPYTCQSNYEQNYHGEISVGESQDSLASDLGCALITICLGATILSDIVNAADRCSNGSGSQCLDAIVDVALDLGCLKMCKLFKGVAKKAIDKGDDEVPNRRRTQRGQPPQVDASKIDGDIADIKAHSRTRSAASTCATHSFDPSTEVEMADGTTKALRDVKVGDEVASTDPESGATSGKVVTAVHINTDTDLADVTVDTNGISVLHTTSHHPFWSKDRHTWINAADLRPGERLASSDGEALVVGVKVFAGRHEMRDLTVASIHTYYVLAGETPVLVHNCGNGNLQPGNSPAASQGTSVHSGPEWAENLDSVGYQPGRALPSGARPDGFTDAGFPVELKPDSRSGIRAGTRQLRRYMNEMGVDYGELWTYKVASNGDITFRLTAVPRSPFRWLKW